MHQVSLVITLYLILSAATVAFASPVSTIVAIYFLAVVNRVIVVTDINQADTSKA